MNNTRLEMNQTGVLTKTIEKFAGISSESDEFEVTIDLEGDWN